MSTGLCLREKPRELCLDFTPQSQKCSKSRHKMSHYWFCVQQLQSTRDLTGELNLLRRMEVTTENSATMASGHFYESICMAHYQDPPFPWPPTPGVCTYIRGGPNLNLLLYSRGIKCQALTEHVNITFASHFGTNSEQSSTICLSSRFIQAF